MYIRTNAYVRTCVRACAHHRPIIGWEFSSAWASLRNREIVNYKLDYLLASPSRRSLFSSPLPVSPRPDCLRYSEKVSIQLAAHRWTVITLAARRPGMLSPLLRVASGHPLAMHRHLRCTDLPYATRIRGGCLMPRITNARGCLRREIIFTRVPFSKFMSRIFWRLFGVVFTCTCAIERL